MYKTKLAFLATVILMVPCFVFAQNNTNSPYTRYGYGILSDKATAAQRGMGGIGYGLRNSQIINTLNPAAFSKVDSMTFMFDMGLTGQFAWFEDGLNKEQKINGNIEYLSLQFPLLKKMGIGIGIEPYSSVGYSYGDTARLPEGDDMVSFLFSGQGGISQVYSALSYDFFDRLSLGVKVSYLFGDITRSNTAAFQAENNYNTDWIDSLRTSGLAYEFGVQYHQSIGKYKTLVIGGIYSPKIPFGGKVSNTILRSTASGSLMSKEYYATKDSVFELPQTFGLGFSYNDLGKLTFGADVLLQQWSDAKFYDHTSALDNRLKINAGGEYIPNFTSNNYLNKIRYRAGLAYTNSYLKVKDSSYKEYGFSIGFGFPMTDRRSFVNLAAEYSLIRPDVKQLINEQYFKLTLSYTFNELWFLKRKVQ
jgi:hypothetical protein